MPPVLLPDTNGVIMDDLLLSVQAFVHVFAEEGLRNFFDIIAIAYEKGAKSSLHRALPDITSNRRYIGSPPCQQISSSLYRPFRYSGPRYIGPPTVARNNLPNIDIFTQQLDNKTLQYPRHREKPLMLSITQIR